jgi:hypothetical protein
MIFMVLDNAVTVQTKNSPINNMEQFIERLALLCDINEHINHKDGERTYIGFRFDEKTGPVRVGKQAFENTTVLKLLQDFSGASKKNAISNMVYVISERAEPPMYGQEQPAKAASEPPPSKETKLNKKAKSKEKPGTIKKEKESGIKIKKEKIEVMDMVVCPYNRFSPSAKSKYRRRVIRNLRR